MGLFRLSRRHVLSGLALTTGALIAPSLGQHSAWAADVIRVGSKNFTEQFILGEMYALVIENVGLKVERKLNLGGTPVAHIAITSGEIDVYPEYTGTGLLTVLKLPSHSDPQVVFEQVSRGYKEQFNLIWLDPAPMNNTQALVMTQAGAERFGIRTISQMAAKASELVMIGPPEFQARPDGLPGLQKAYGSFRLRGFRAVDPGLRYIGLVNGQADVAVAFGTDGQISHYNLVLLEDDKNFFPPYQVAPVIRQETLSAHPKIGEALNALSPLLTDATMQRLNFKVEGNQREPAQVAYEFLMEAKILA